MDNRMLVLLFSKRVVDEEIRKNQLERKVESGELMSFGEKYTGQFDREFYVADEKGKKWAVCLKVDKYVDEVIEEDELEDTSKGDYSGLFVCLVSLNLDILPQSTVSAEKRQWNGRTRLRRCVNEAAQ